MSAQSPAHSMKLASPDFGVGVRRHMAQGEVAWRHLFCVCDDALSKKSSSCKIIRKGATRAAAAPRPQQQQVAGNRSVEQPKKYSSAKLFVFLMIVMRRGGPGLM